MIQDDLLLAACERMTCDDAQEIADFVADRLAHQLCEGSTLAKAKALRPFWDDDEVVQFTL